MQELEFKLLAYLNEELEEKERLQVEQWVASSPANQKTFDEVSKIYESSALDPEKFNPDVDQAWNSVSDATSQSGVTKSNMIYRFAAMIALAIGFGLVAYQFQQADTLVAKTGDNETKMVELADGSVVWLNENSVFEYDADMASDERTVSLNGQAYFDVAKDPERPFVIVGAKTTVQVLGTSFNLISENNYSNLNVTSGKVAFALTADEDIKLVLEKGTQATFDNNKLVKNDTFNENANSWVTRDFVFRSSPLYKVAETLSEHFDVKIKIDETIKNCLITSSFEDKELDEILETLEVIANIKSQKKGKTIKLTGPGC